MFIQPMKPRGIYCWANFQTPTATNTARYDELTAKIKVEEGVLATLSIITSPAAYAQQYATVAKYKLQRDALEQSKNATKDIMQSMSSKPVVLYGVTKLDVSWENTIGNKQGLRANFLQPWFNRPVEIKIEGESYMGAWGGETVSASINSLYGKQTTPNVFDKVKTWVSDAQRGVQQFIQNVTTAVNAKAYQTTGPFEDQTISGLQALISYFPAGPSGIMGKNASNITFQLLIENEPTGNATDPYAVFEGYIKRFNYSESVENPYIQTYTIEFVGEPKTKATIGTQEVNAQLELSKMGVTTAISASGKAITLFTLG